VIVTDLLHAGDAIDNLRPFKQLVIWDRFQLFSYGFTELVELGFHPNKSFLDKELELASSLFGRSFPVRLVACY
jgi:hypothetical protein